MRTSGVVGFLAAIVLGAMAAYIKTDRLGFVLAVVVQFILLEQHFSVPVKELLQINGAPDLFPVMSQRFGYFGKQLFSYFMRADRPEPFRQVITLQDLFPDSVDIAVINVISKTVYRDCFRFNDRTLHIVK